MTRHKFIFLTAVSALGSLLFAVGGLLFGEIVGWQQPGLAVFVPGSISVIIGLAMVVAVFIDILEM
jgi:hypothetical protein